MHDLHDLVSASFQALLGRSPENTEVVDHFAALGSATEIIRRISTSAEAEKKRLQNQDCLFFNYSSIFDAEEILRRYSKDGIQSDPRFFINFLGVRMEEIYLPQILTGRAGTVEGLPYPANWHADIAEWAAALRSIDLSSKTFTVAELGCGWGCWINNTGVAARDRGFAAKLIGVEGDRGHLNFARRCCSLNGFDDAQIELHYGIAAPQEGYALFPKQIESGQNWGLQPIFGASSDERRDFLSSGLYEELPMISIDRLIGANAKLDLLHIDIQGGEGSLLAQAFSVVSRKVSYIVVGTHSREIEGSIISTMKQGNWRLEIERPAIVKLSNNGPLTLVDGVQGWRNMDLAPDIS